MTTSVQVKIADEIVKLVPKIEERTIGVLVERELVKRSECLTRSIDTLEKLEKELNRIKPDLTSFDSEGKMLAKTYSKPVMDARNKQQAKVDKLTKAINKALETNDFNDLYNFKADGSSEQSDGAGEQQDS